MPARATPEASQPATTLSLIRLSGKRMMRLILRPRRRVSLLLASLLAAWIPQFAAALDQNALPTQGSVKVGSGQISQSGSNMVVNQGSARLGVDWQTFNIGANGSVTFVQPGRDAVALNRVVGNDASQIFGRLSANGQVFLVNPNGVLFAPGSKVDVGGLVASSLDLSQDDFKNGKYQFVGIDSNGRVTNQGDIQGATGGYVALFAPQVKNEGSINVPVGQVVLAGRRAVTVDITGSGLISAVIQQGAANSSAENSGTLTANGGSVRMTAKAAQDTAGGLVNNTGIVKANTLVNKNGEIWLLGDSVSSTGEVRAEGDSTQAGGLVHIEAASVALGGSISADGASGGQIVVEAGQHLSLADKVSARGLNGQGSQGGQGGRVAYSSGGGVLESSTSVTNVDGATDGGDITVNAASGISSSGHYYAAGATGKGGKIDVSAHTVYLLSAELDASGALGGGRIRVGGDFQGGKGPAPSNADEVNHLFVRRWEDSVALASADSAFINDATSLNVSSNNGVGGTAIVWSNTQTTFLGSINAQGAAGGGAVEISSGESLKRAALDRVTIGSGGQLLLDPKNLVIGNADALKQWQYQAVLESVYAWKASVPVLANSDYLGSSVALSEDARLLAVGTVRDDGAAGNVVDAGAVHLFAFQDNVFNGGALVGTVGNGYLGGKNVSVPVAAADQFGSSVALSASGQQLAVGAINDDGATNQLTNSGAVHLFTFADTAFGGGLKVGTMGAGYTGAGNLDVSLSASDNFGQSVALSGDATRMAVGAPLDDGLTGTRYDAGAVHLFTFGAGFSSAAKVGTVGSDYAGAGNLSLAWNNYDHFGLAVALSRDGTAMAAGTELGDSFGTATGDYGRVSLFTLNSAFAPSLLGTIGQGYTGTNDINQTLDASDYFGSALALNGDGTRLVVGAPYDDGFSNANSNAGAVYLFTFTNTGFVGGSLVGTMGVGYTGGGNVDVPLSNSDYFGTGVALSGDAMHLAVGAYADDGATGTAYDSGAVHLFSFNDTSFGAGRLVGSVGQDYRDDRGTGISLDGERSAGNDWAGTAIALNSNARLLAVGAPGDDGYGDSATDTGAVHLITFADGDFGGAALSGTVGHGYTGGNNVEVSLGANDEFGYGVALSGDGSKLAVGAWGDGGANNTVSNAGAVHLFTFANTSFGGGQKVGTVGVGYTGTNDVNLALDANDRFGVSVALNLDGSRMAAGAYLDDGSSTSYVGDSGAVHLFTFGPGFTGGSKAATIGHGYTAVPGTNSNIPVTLGYYDYFGVSVALSSDGTKLAVGAYGDDGATNANADQGAVYLYSFTDATGAFTGGSLASTIGAGYTTTMAAGNVDLVLGNSDYLGRAVALNASGTLLAAGASYDDGASNGRSNTGAVHLFTFGNASFGGAALAGSIGEGYTGGRNVDVRLDDTDIFGTSVALNGSGDRLAVGVPYDDGAKNAVADANSGAVRLFSFADTAFNGGRLAGKIGNGYTSETGLSLDLYGSRNWAGDRAGSAVALSGDTRQLAIGVPLNDGNLENPWNGGNYGAVHLVTFSDGNFAGGSLVGTIGQGYTGGKNIDVALDANDEFGAAVALSGDGIHLAVGAPKDDGFNNPNSNAGALHLFTFADTSFAGGQKIGTMGSGYTGSNDVDVGLYSSDYFGASVALNQDGTRLAAGAPGDGGVAGTYYYDFGAVHLFTFGAGFSTGSKVGTLGSGYTIAQDADNINIALRSYDYFGQSVALNSAGTLLAVGAPLDDGFAGTAGDSGAVRLFTFGNAFASGAVVATLGVGYSGLHDVDLGLDNSDAFGHAVALSASGQQLAVGTPYDAGPTNAQYRSGAVHLFTFSDTAFSAGTLAGTLGSGYSGGKNVDSSSAYNDNFGWSVALNSAGDRLAAGAPLDDGADGSRTDSGAVQLFSFTDSQFSGGKLVGRIGNGYQTETSLALNVLGNRSWGGDQAGSAVALSADATQMAIGAPYDDGNQAPTANTHSGAVHLLTFADANFGGAAVAGTLGAGYVGGKNIDVALDANDNFGLSVALSGDGLHLAVGAPEADGFSNGFGSSGAVHLFTFGDTLFASGQQTGTMGLNYSGGGNVDVALGSGDNFGYSVALSSDGTRLAVGARYDDGFNNAVYNSGAVHLFTFSNNSFGGVQELGTVGAGYVSTGDVAVALDDSDYFGWSVALNGDSTRLAVGAPRDQGFNNLGVYTGGAVHLFTFSTTGFGGGQLAGTVGRGYVGAGDVNVPVDAYDNFGSAVALSSDASKLVVGAPQDSGFNNVYYYSGAVHTFAFGSGFGTGSLVGSLGGGYTGDNDLNLAASNPYYSYFGRAVAINGDGTRLAVGVPLDDGANLTASDAGAVQLFSLGAGLTTPAKLGTIGNGYTGTASLDAPFTGSGSSYAYNTTYGYLYGDQLGTSVALSADTTLLAIGAPGDVGGNLQTPLAGAGAVHLVTFEDGNFGGASLAGTIGMGYSGGKNINVALDSNDMFGTGVALSRDGTHLAVGAPQDDGAANSVVDAGALHLFTFNDTRFGGGQKTGTMGVGYSGTQDVNLTLLANSYLGSAVALNTDGSRLAVGAPSYSGTGAVHLFTFGTGFSAGTQIGSIGLASTYTQLADADNVPIALDTYDHFGSALALSGDGRQLAVGTVGDAGFANTVGSAGAVHLFTFGNAFTSGSAVGTLGLGYSGGVSMNVALNSSDYFGSALALSTDGTRLAVGAMYADGAGLGASNSGAVQLFTFTDTLFGGGQKIATVGAGYSDTKDVNVSLNNSDHFGRSVALSGDGSRLVVGAPGDAGARNEVAYSGAAHLFRFADTSFSAGQRAGGIGQGYVPLAQAIDLPFVGGGNGPGDQFGTAVSLSADARQLAVGSPGDVGVSKGNLLTSQGAVQLITFADGDFGGAQLAATIGGGYTGGNNIDVSLNANDDFGAAVALSRDGRSLAVGAPGDDGANNSRNDSGAVHLFSFGNTSFASGQKSATLGFGYYGGNNRALALDVSDAFGQSVALNTDGTRLAVGAPRDDGAPNNKYDSGAVHLFTFGAGFTAGSQTGTVGSGYAGVGDVSVAIDNSDNFGWSVALSGDGRQLAVGAPQDYGQGNLVTYAGAVHLFGFADAFASGAKVGTVGQGYNATGDLGTSLDTSDYFGKSVALSTDGTRLVVGASGDDGAYDTRGDYGSIQLFSFGAGFTAGSKVGTIGADYVGAKDVNFVGNTNYDTALGWSAAVNGDASRLAGGLIYDSGLQNQRYQAGAVKLFSFSDGNYSDGRLAGTLGYGYQSAATALSLPWTGAASYAGDAFGSSVAFDATGNLLAVGASGDDGFGNGRAASGAVYLFQFGGAGNTQASLAGTMGWGYSGGKNVDVALDAGDAFGRAVALSASATRAVVGASNDDGQGNVVTDAGAVHTFSFADSAFSGGQHTGTIGFGYTGTGNLAVNTLDYLDHFGTALAVSADASLLAVGAPLDKGVANSYSSSTAGYGAVHLFQLAGNAWSKTGTLGFGYTDAGSANLTTTLGNTDNFGASVAMSADGSLLAAGANAASGLNNPLTYSGEVHLFTMGTGFAAPAKVGTLGAGYTANLTDADTTNDSHLNVSTLASSDYFGTALSMTADGRHLAVGTPRDDGGTDVNYDSGAVHIFSFADSSFGTPARLASVGAGYSAVGDLQNKIASSDYFGSAVAFNADGSRLAVGIARDNGVSVAKTAAGAVRVFTFADSSYAQGFEITALGDGRLPGNVSFPLVTTNDRFGAAVALSSDGTRLAVGAPGDDGLANDRADAGAVHVFSFTDANFAGSRLEASLGYGYTGGKNVNVGLGWGDNFGSAVALNASANQLAVGAPNDDGAGNDRQDAGAVHLFGFTDATFSGGSQTGTLGYGYTGAADANLATLDTLDHFGSAVALSANAQRLVVGTPGDNGASNTNADAGAVQRFTFTNTAFGGVALAGTVGSGYSGGGDVNLALESSDNFGQAVALNGDATLLAVGAPGDDGFENSSNYYYYGYGAGAVHLFQFADTSFAVPAKLGTVGLGYVGAGDVNLPVDYDDHFGSAVALNSSGTVLAVGANYDDGAANNRAQAGSVSLFNFADTAFGSGALSNTLGYGYTSIGQVPVTLNTYDYFGSAVALNGAGDRLVVGAPGHDTSGGYTLTDTGAAYLFEASTLSPSANLASLGYADAPSTTAAVSISDLATTLASGTSVSLQANNDLMLADTLNVSGSSGGNLTLQAGRRVLLNGDISTANGNLAIKANAPVADGVVAAERNTGAAVITMQAGRVINAGTGNVSLTLADGAGLTDTTSGAITLGNISAGAITVENLGTSGGTNMVLNGQLASSGDIVLATTVGNLTNNYGASALSSSAGRWLLYTGDWNSTIETGLVGAAGGSMPRLYNQTYALNPPSGVAAGNHVLYRSQPTATIYANSASKVYGSADPTLSYYAYGLVSDDGVADTFATAGFSAPTLTLPVVSDPLYRAVGSYAISVAYSQTGSNAGYVVNANNAGGTLSVTPKSLVLNGLSVNAKTYDGNNTATIASLGTIDGVLAGDNLLIDSTLATASFSDAHAGSGKSVHITGITLGGTAFANYSVNDLYTSANINRKTVTLASFVANDKTYDGGVTATISSYGALSGLVGSETLVVGGGNARFADKNAGTGKTVTLSSALLSNGSGLASDYVLGSPLPTTTASISQKSINASGTRVYDGSTDVLAGALSLLGTVGSDQVSLSGAGTVGNKNVGSAKPITLGTLAVSGTDAGNYTLGGGSLSITPKQLGVTGMSVQNRVYDGTTTADYTGTPTLGGSLVAGDNATLTLTNLSIAFADKNAGYNKTLVATGLSLAGADAGNYQVVVADTASIAPRSLNITATGQSKVYNGDRAATVSYADNRISGDVLGIAGTALFDTKNVGTGKTINVSLALSGTDAANYLPNASTTTSGNITARALTINATAQNKVYDQTNAASVSFTDNRIAGDTLVLNALASFASKDVGNNKAVSGTLSVSGADVGNYSFGTSLNLSANITPKLLLAHGSRVYDGFALVSAADLGLDSVFAGDAVSLGGSGNMLDKNVGLNKGVSGGTLALAGLDAPNYSLSAASVDITPRLLTVSGISAQDRVYDGTKNAVATGTPVLSGTVLANDVVTTIPTPSITVEFSDKNAGQNKQLIVAGGLITGADAGNYQVVVQGTANISQRNLAIQATAQDKVYDGSRTATLQLSDDRIANDALSIVASGLFADKNVGTNKPVAVTMAVTGVDATNYLYTPVTSSAASISQRALNVTATAANRVYDGNTVAALTLADNRVAGDTLTVTGSGSFADKNAGNAKPVNVALSYAGADLGNYSVANSLATNANISVRTLTFSNLTVGDKIYDGTTDASISGNYSLASGLVTGDAITADISSAIASFADKNAGTNKAVTVTGVALSGADAGNYSVASSVGTASILKKTVDVRGLTPDSKVYDGSKSATVTGTPDVTASFVAGDTVALNTGSFTVEFANKNVGANKALTVTGNLLTGADAGNYEALLNTTASITARPLSVNATVASRVYDGTTTAAVSFTDNRVLGDDLSLSGSSVFADKNAGANKAVSVTGISLGGVDALNYSFATSTIDTSASIYAKTITGSGSRVYDGSTALPSGTLSFAGLVSGDQVGLGASVALQDKNVGTNKAFNSTLLLEGTDAANYILSGLGYAITPKTLTVTGLTAASKAYDGSTSATATGTASLGLELVAGDQVTADLSTIGFAFLDKNVGVGKTLAVSGNVLSGADAANYQTVLSATADITTRLLTVTGVGAENKVYDGTTVATKLLTGTPTLTGGIVSGDDFTVDLSNLAVAFADKNAGNAKTLLVSGASMGGTDAGNYSVSIPNATANISQRSLSFTAQNKVYDGTALATVLTDQISGDALNVSATGAFADKHAGSNKAVSISALSVSGADATNYSYTTTDFTSTATITAKDINAVGSKVYDGSTAIATAGLNFDGVVTGDVLALSGSVALVDKQVGNNKAFSGGLLLGGASAADYNLLSLQYAVTPKILTVSGLTAANKVYDGNTSATASGTPAIGLELVAGDQVTANLSNLSFAFLDKHAGVGKAVQVTGNVLSGADAGNYQALLSATANITPRLLTVTGVGAQTKVYDGTAAATRLLTATPAVSGGILSGDDFAVDLSNLSVAFADVNVGSAKTLLVSGAVGSGADAGNYSVYVPGSIADITPRPLHVTANNVVRLTGEPDPNPFGYSVGQGGLVNGDALQSVAIATPPGSAAASGGTVLTLRPSNVVFATGSASNYDVQLDDGYLIVLPQPAAPTNVEPDPLPTALFVELDPAQQGQAQSESNNQQTELLARLSAPRFVPFEPARRSNQIAPELDELRRAVQQLAQAARGNSLAVLPTLRQQPVLQWDPSMAPAVLNPAGRNE